MRLVETEEYDILKDLAYEAKNLCYTPISDDEAFQRALTRLVSYEDEQEIKRFKEAKEATQG